MSKQTAFMWSWNGYPAQHDATMTRERMARLLMAWRRTTRLTSHNTRLRKLERLGMHHYRVTDLRHGGEFAVVSWTAPHQ